MKQSAVEWFANRISHGGLVSKKQFDELLEQAKEMELDKLKEAYAMGRSGNSIKEFNEAFKQEQ